MLDFGVLRRVLVSWKIGGFRLTGFNGFNGFCGFEGTHPVLVEVQGSIILHHDKTSRRGGCSRLAGCSRRAGCSRELQQDVSGEHAVRCAPLPGELAVAQLVQGGVHLPLTHGL